MQKWFPFSSTKRNCPLNTYEVGPLPRAVCVHVIIDFCHYTPLSHCLYALTDITVNSSDKMFWNSEVLIMVVSPMKSVMSNSRDTSNDLRSFKYVIAHWWVSRTKGVCSQSLILFFFNKLWKSQELVNLEEHPFVKKA